MIASIQQRYTREFIFISVSYYLHYCSTIEMLIGGVTYFCVRILHCIYANSDIFGDLWPSFRYGFFGYFIDTNASCLGDDYSDVAYIKTCIWIMNYMGIISLGKMNYKQ